MANTPKKMQDPTEAALSAIQDALNLREGEQEAAPIQPPEPPAAVEPISAARETRRRTRSNPAAIDEEKFFSEATASAREVSVDEPPPPSQPRAANDDRQSVGQILQTLQRRPSRAPYMIAGLFGLVWAAMGLTLAYLGTDLGRVGGRGAASMELFGLVAAIGVP